MNADRPDGGPVRVSDILHGISETYADGGATIGNLLDAFGKRSFGAALFLFSLPSTLLLSSIPGASTVFAVPILLLAVQWLAGAENPWLPRRARRYRLPADALTRIVRGAGRFLGWIERHRLLKPRLAAMSGPWMQRLSAGIVLVAGIVLFLPIPFGNFPPSIAITLIALGSIERDGVMILLGDLVGVVGSVVLLGALTLGIGHSWAMLFG